MPYSLIWIALLPGVVAGIVVNYLADVLPVTRQLTRPICPVCKSVPSMADYLLLHSCVHCGARQSLRHWIVLAAFILASLATWIHPAHRLGYPLGLILLIYLGAVVVIDVEYRVILSEISLAGLILGGAIGIGTRGFATTFFGGLAGYGIMLALYLLGAVYTRWISRRRVSTQTDAGIQTNMGMDMAIPAESEQDSGAEGDDVALGFGDVNLTGILGLILGWPVIIAGLLAGILAGGAASLVYILILVAIKRYRISTAMPYAPFLVFGAAVFIYGF